MLRILLLLTVLSGCAPVDVNHYKNNTPKLEVKTFFDGKLKASGIVKNRKGEVIRYFSADINAEWKDGVGTLYEVFIFDDGEQQTRIWTLQAINEHTFTASANDVVGESTVHTAGNAMFLQYTLTIPYKDSTIDVQVDDKMYLVNESTLINESNLTKFGFDIGYVTLSIVKL